MRGNLLWVGAALLFSGCVERPTESPRTEAFPGPAAFEAAIRANLPSGPLDHNRLFRAAADLEPWFGGLYVEDGGLRVLATDLAVAGSRVAQVTEGLLQAAGRSDLAIRAGAVQLVEARYSFRQLYEWRSLLLPEVHRFGVHRVVIDERMNRIDLRTESAADAEALSQWAEGQGVPPSGLAVRAAARAEFDYGIGGNGIVVRWGHGGRAEACTLAQVVTRRIRYG